MDKDDVKQTATVTVRVHCTVDVVTRVGGHTSLISAAQGACDRACAVVHELLRDGPGDVHRVDGCAPHAYAKDVSARLEPIE